MVAAGLWKQADIQQLECQLYREGSALSKQISSAAILNVLQYCKPSWEVISRLAKEASLKAVNQRSIKDYYSKGPKVQSATQTRVPTNLRWMKEYNLKSGGTSSSRRSCRT
jgi:hypothetical protein